MDNDQIKYIANEFKRLSKLYNLNVKKIKLEKDINYWFITYKYNAVGGYTIKQALDRFEKEYEQKNINKSIQQHLKHVTNSESMLNKLLKFFK